MTDDTTTTKNLNESVDKIRLKTALKRGTGTRDEDKLKVDVRGDDPHDTAARLEKTLAALEEFGVADALRNTQPGDADE